MAQFRYVCRIRDGVINWEKSCQQEYALREGWDYNIEIWHRQNDGEGVYIFLIWNDVTGEICEPTKAK